MMRDGLHLQPIDSGTKSSYAPLSCGKPLDFIRNMRPFRICPYFLQGYELLTLTLH